MVLPRRIRIKEYRGMKDYIKYNALDLEARFEALMLYMDRKLQKEVEQPYTYIRKRPM